VCSSVAECAGFLKFGKPGEGGDVQNNVAFSSVVMCAGFLTKEAYPLANGPASWTEGAKEDDSSEVPAVDGSTSTSSVRDSDDTMSYVSADSSVARLSRRQRRNAKSQRNKLAEEESRRTIAHEEAALFKAKLITANGGATLREQVEAFNDDDKDQLIDIFLGRSAPSGPRITRDQISKQCKDDDITVYIGMLGAVVDAV
jgi:hypothetical protein